MKVVLAGLVLVAGCDQVFGLDRGESDGSSESLCFGGQHVGAGGVFELCLDAPPQAELVMAASITTGRLGEMGDCNQVVTQTDPRPTEVCVIAAYEIQIPATVRVLGGRPLVLIAAHDLSLSGELDASSRIGDMAGAGSGHGACDVGNGENSTGSGGGGGGAGGSFGSAGGKGGDGPVASGGSADAATSLGFVRGGCDGSNGGDGSGALVLGGRGGASGGAIYLVAGRTVTVSGTINVSGQGGHGGRKNITGGGSGGGGGGSGGLIGIDAPVIDLARTAILVANGAGAGGGGGDNNNGGDGSEVDVVGDPFPFQTPGGNPGLNGGGNAGGGGHVMSLAGGSGANAIPGGGGGGGGGVGHIRLYSPDRRDPGAMISPAPNPPP